jgi:hypothetical protein
MRTTATLLACALAASIVAAGGAQDYPHAFPRTGTKKLLDNERVTVWDVRWVKNVEQPYHRHRFDMAGVYVQYGPIRVTNVDGTVNPVVPFEVPRPYFQPKNITHKEEAIGFPADAPERQAIMIDLKDVVVPPVARPGMTNAFPREGARQAIDNARVVEWDYTWQPGRPVATHVHDKDSIEVFFTGGTIRYITPDGKQESKAVAFRDFRFVPRGTVDSEEAVAGAPRAVIVEIK